MRGHQGSPHAIQALSTQEDITSLCNGHRSLQKFTAGQSAEDKGVCGTLTVDSYVTHPKVIKDYIKRPGSWDGGGRGGSRKS